MNSTTTPLKLFKENVWDNNPVVIQILGICSTLAVTNSLTNTVIMTVGLVFVTALTNTTVSLLKEIMPRKVRMMEQTLIISFYVIIVDILLKAYFPTVSKALGPYVGLIITNCIIMGRAEAFAQSHGVLFSFWDGLTSALGYMWILLLIAAVRELLGFGTLLGWQVTPDTFRKWVIMVMPPSAFFLLGIQIWILKSIMLNKRK